MRTLPDKEFVQNLEFTGVPYSSIGKRWDSSYFMYEMRPISLHEFSQSLLNSSIVSPLIVPTIRGVPSSNTDMYHARLVGAITPPVQHGGI